MKNKKAIPKAIEIIFDILYLVSMLCMAAVLLTQRAAPVKVLWGVMALLMAVGDSFHLVPRIAAALGSEDKYKAAKGIGKQITSITMTIFYILLWHAGELLFVFKLPVLTAAVYILAAVRIIVCLMPQNSWASGTENFAFAIYRNVPFVLQGLIVIAVFMLYGGFSGTVGWVWLAVLLSFAFYMPVALFSAKNPKLGMLMLPKSCAYIWIIAVGLTL